MGDITCRADGRYSYPDSLRATGIYPGAVMVSEVLARQNGTIDVISNGQRYNLRIPRGVVGGSLQEAIRAEVIRVIFHGHGTSGERRWHWMGIFPTRVGPREMEVSSLTGVIEAWLLEMGNAAADGRVDCRTPVQIDLDRHVYEPAPRRSPY